MSNSQVLLNKIGENGRLSVFELNDNELQIAIELKSKGLIISKRFQTDIYGNDHSIPVPYLFKNDKSSIQHLYVN